MCEETDGEAHSLHTLTANIGHVDPLAPKEHANMISRQQLEIGAHCGGA
jgi:hypothetical protein